MFGLPSDSDVVADGLSDAVVELAGSRNVLDARLVELIGQVWASGAWEGWGLRSIHHWVTLRCGVSPAQARTLVGCARRLGELPATRARFAAGELSVDQVAVITRIVPTHADAEVAEVAGRLAVPQLRNLLRGYAWPTPPPDPDIQPDTGPVEEERRVGFGYDDDGTWSLSVRLPGDEGAVIEAALGAKRDQLWQAAEDKADREQITWADALLALVDAGASAGPTRAARDRYQVVLHFEATPDDAPALRVHLGPPLPDSRRRFLLCDATVRTVSEIGGLAVNVGRAQHIVPDRTRILVEHRDQGCRVPGCDQRTVQVHHIIHWEDQGPTDTPNLVCLCRAHHRMHHQGRLGIEGNADEPDGLGFTDRHRRPLTRAGPAPPDLTPDWIPPPSSWVPPTGEPIHTQWVDFTHPQDWAV